MTLKQILNEVNEEKHTKEGVIKNPSKNDIRKTFEGNDFNFIIEMGSNSNKDVYAFPKSMKDDEVKELLSGNLSRVTIKGSSDSNGDIEPSFEHTIGMRSQKLQRQIIRSLKKTGLKRWAGRNSTKKTDTHTRAYQAYQG